MKNEAMERETHRVAPAYLAGVNELNQQKSLRARTLCVWLAAAAAVSLLGAATPPGASEVRLVLRHVDKNTFAAALTDGEAGTRRQFSPPYTLEVRIGDQVQRLLDPATGKPLTVRLADEQPRTAMCDELTLPGAAPGVYVLKATVLQGGRPAAVAPFEARVQVGCVNPARTTYMECFLNCEKWEVRW
jgi:hypothetical protein